MPPSAEERREGDRHLARRRAVPGEQARTTGRARRPCRANIATGTVRPSAKPSRSASFTSPMPIPRRVGEHGDEEEERGAERRRASHSTVGSDDACARRARSPPPAARSGSGRSVRSKSIAESATSTAQKNAADRRVPGEPEAPEARGDEQTRSRARRRDSATRSSAPQFRQRPRSSELREHGNVVVPGDRRPAAHAGGARARRSSAAAGRAQRRRSETTRRRARERRRCLRQQAPCEQSRRRLAAAPQHDAVAPGHRRGPLRNAMSSTRW